MSVYYERDLADLYFSVEQQQELLPEEVRNSLRRAHEELRSIDIKQDKAFYIVRKDLKKWTMKHYPVIKTEKSIFLDDYYNNICACEIDYLPLVAHKLIEDKKAGLDPRTFFKKLGKEYNRLEKLSKPKLMEEDDRDKNPGLTDAEWDIKREECNREALLRYNYLLKLKNDFFATMHSTLLKIFPEIRNFDNEDTIVFNYFMEDAFLIVFKFTDRLLKIISYGLKLDYCELADKDFDKAISKCSKKKQAEEKEKEIRRWKGEKI